MSENKVHLLNTSSKISIKSGIFKKQQSECYPDFRLGVDVTPLKTKYKGERPNVTLFGDSLTRFGHDVNNGCWIPMLAHKLADYFDVNSRGYSGFTTREAVKVLEQEFPQNYVDRMELIIIFFGNNDSWQDSLISVSHEEFNKNLRDIVYFFNARGLSNSKMVFITPAPLHFDTFNAFSRKTNLKANKSKEHESKYAEIVSNVAKDLSITCLDFYSIASNNEDFSNLFYDGLHLSRDGGDLLYLHLWPLVEEKLEESFGKPVWHLFTQHPSDSNEDLMREYGYIK